MATSVKQENRYRNMVIQQNNAISRHQREMEAMLMERGPRPAVSGPKPSATRHQVRSWMRHNCEGYESATEIAEAANAALDLPSGAMDDESHWVWDEALSALEWLAA